MTERRCWAIKGYDQWEKFEACIASMMEEFDVDQMGVGSLQTSSSQGWCGRFLSSMYPTEGGVECTERLQPRLFMEPV